MRTLSSRSPWQRAYAEASSRGRSRSRFRCPHTSPDPYQKAARKETPGPQARCGVCDEILGRLGRCPATAPRAPVAARDHEVAVRGERLLVRGRPVTEEAPL